jgi:hypothetical protein
LPPGGTSARCGEDTEGALTCSGNASGAAARRLSTAVPRYDQAATKYPTPYGASS